MPPKMTRRPSAPGFIIRTHYMEPLNLTVTELALRLGISRKTLSKILNERGSVSPDMALRLSRAFNTTPQLWLNLQQTLDLWLAENTPGDWQKVPLYPWGKGRLHEIEIQQNIILSSSHEDPGQITTWSSKQQSWCADLIWISKSTNGYHK